jgi:hypothetical protein
MPAASAVSPPLRSSWQRAVVATEASVARTLATADRLAASASRLDRGNRLLNECDPRVGRARRRRRETPAVSGDPESHDRPVGVGARRNALAIAHLPSAHPIVLGSLQLRPGARTVHFRSRLVT